MTIRMRTKDGKLFSGYFGLDNGSLKSKEAVIMSSDLKDAGIDKVNDVALNFEVYDDTSYDTLASIGPLNITIDDNGDIAWQKVYRDAETIAEVQSLLNAVGYDCGAADGVAGKLTNNMILQFEKDHGLTENTDITDELLEALRAANQ